MYIPYQEIADNLGLKSDDTLLIASDISKLAYNTFKNKSLSSIVSNDANVAAAQIAQYSLPGYTRQAIGSVNGMIFPTPPRSASQLPVGQVGFLPNGQGG